MLNVRVYVLLSLGKLFSRFEFIPQSSTACLEGGRRGLNFFVHFF